MIDECLITVCKVVQAAYDAAEEEEEAQTMEKMRSASGGFPASPTDTQKEAAGVQTPTAVGVNLCTEHCVGCIYLKYGSFFRDVGRI